MTFLGWSSDPLKGLSDLQLWDDKVTLNHLVPGFFFQFHPFFAVPAASGTARGEFVVKSYPNSPCQHGDKDDLVHHRTWNF